MILRYVDADGDEVEVEVLAFQLRAERRDMVTRDVAIHQGPDGRGGIREEPGAITWTITEPNPGAAVEVAVEKWKWEA